MGGGDFLSNALHLDLSMLLISSELCNIVPPKYVQFIGFDYKLHLILYFL